MAKSVNQGNAEQFQKGLRQWADMVDGNVLRHKVAATRSILTELVYSTPVVSGLTRSNWRVSVGARTSAVVGIRSAAATINEGVAKVRNAGRQSTIYIANHVPWLFKLNRHSLQQAPGWIDRAVMRGIGVARALRMK